MKILIDYPDMDGREAIPFPLRVEDAAGYLVLWVERRDGNLVMCYSVARDRDSINGDEATRGDEMMTDLENAARSFMTMFNLKYEEEDGRSSKESEK
jgi:hypothetical protein